MKKNIFLHLTIATFFLGLSACTDDNLLPPVENNVPTIDAGLLEDYYFILDTDIPQTHMPQTRVSYINERESYFDEGDEMGIFVINENNELISSANGNATTANVRYKVTNVTNIADNSVRQECIQKPRPEPRRAEESASAKDIPTTCSTYIPTP